MSLAWTRWMILVAAALSAAPTLLAQPQFKGMGMPPPGAVPTPYVPFVKAIDNEGHVYGEGSGQGFDWSPYLEKYTLLFGLEEPQYGRVTSSVVDGKSLFGYGFIGTTAVPLVWSDRSKPPLAIAGFPAGWQVTSVHSDAVGTSVAGYMQHIATFKRAMIIWHATGPYMGWEFIETFPPGMAYPVPKDTSEDGAIVFGGSAMVSGFQAIRWTKATGIETLGDFAGGDFNSRLNACSGNGMLAVGNGFPSTGELSAAIWTQTTSWVECGKLKPEHIGAGFEDVDAAGRTAVGVSDYSVADRTGILWNARDGMRSIEEVLVSDYGLVEATPWKLTDVLVISPNGRFVAGAGRNPQNEFAAWWAEIRPFCYADCDNSTSPKGKNAGPPVLDIDDFICFQTKYAIGDYLYADCDLNGYLEIDDFICFITKFATGCD